MRPTTLVSILALLTTAAGTAAAQSVERTVAESLAVSGSDSGDYRSKANDWMIMPTGTSTVSGALDFMTADAGLGDDGLRFTDIVLTSIRARHALTRRLEIHGAASFLPKQPSFADELIWQGGSAGARVGFGKRYAAYATASGGSLLADRGLWAAGAGGLQARKSLHETLVLEGGLGGAYTSLFEDKRDAPSWITEVTASGELVFREPHGMMAGWIGTEFRFPLASDSSMSDVGEMPYQPQTRVNFHLGVVLSYIPDWDIFARYVVVDRGDAVDPTTTLPILEGGFDQRHLLIGLTRRFKGGKSHRQPIYLAE